MRLATERQQRAEWFGETRCGIGRRMAIDVLQPTRRTRFSRQQPRFDFAVRHDTRRKIEDQRFVSCWDGDAHRISADASFESTRRSNAAQHTVVIDPHHRGNAAACGQFNPLGQPSDVTGVLQRATGDAECSAFRNQRTDQTTRENLSKFALAVRNQQCRSLSQYLPFDSGT